MKRRVRMLFLGGAKRVSLAERFVSAGKSLGTKVEILDYELSPEVPLAVLAKIIIGLRWDDKLVLKHLEDTIRTFAIDVVLPLVDPATIVAARLAERLEECVFVPSASEAVVNTFFDKRSTSSWSRRHKILIPAEGSSLPAIAKPRFGSASNGVEIIGTRRRLQHYRNRNDFIVQRFIKGTEYTVDGYVNPAFQIISMVPRERIETLGGEATKSRTVRDDEIIQISCNIARLARLKGPITLQFIREWHTQKLYFIELNPRFGGGAICSIEAGANSPLFLLSDCLGKKYTYDNASWMTGVLMLRRFSEFFLTCK
jgi:carbamoyl-phosphate synthase large subunit